jgi:formamidopyrimidine-DNA glycosylase
MPELPEVENLSRGVRSHVLARTISGVAFFRDDIREPIDKSAIQNVLMDQKVTNVFRRGKYLLLQTNQGGLGIHLGMSGRLIQSTSEVPSAPHTHAVFSFDVQGGDRIYYHFIDPRRFGRLFALTSSEMKQLDHPFLATLGVEPLDENVNLARHLFKESRKRSQGVKLFIMDSAVVVGVGNIYASESLWKAKIRPTTQAKKLTLAQYEIVSRTIQVTLQQSIRNGGTTFRDYRNHANEPGNNQQDLAVYGRESEPCLRCQRKILRLVQGGRSTFYCKFCQK